MFEGMHVVTLNPADLKSLELLYDYTKFHIGIYLTLTATYIALTTASINNEKLFEIRGYCVIAAILGFVVAGFAGGVIVSSITQCNCSSSQQFLNQPLGPYDFQWFYGLTWTQIEHTAFWIGLVAAIFSIKGIGRSK